MNHLKRAASIMLAAASIAAYATSASAVSFSKGDITMDGEIDSYDALLILQASMDSSYLTDEEYWIADFNEDASIDSEDALLTLRTSVGAYEVQVSGTQVAEMKGWSAADVIARVGPLFTEDQRKTGVLASVSLAQFILESGYGQSKLSIEANNCFGIKGQKESVPRVDCPWDGVSVYTISTKEYDAYGNSYYINADFRKYDCMEDSIEDHSRILVNSSYDGVHFLYDGIVGCTDYRKAAQIIYNGGYATSPDYVDYLCRLIEQWDLTQYDLNNYQQPTSTASVSESKQKLYRVRYVWDDESSQIGAFAFFENAVECARLNPGYSVYDENGSNVYTS